MEAVSVYFFPFSFLIKLFFRDNPILINIQADRKISDLEHADNLLRLSGSQNKLRVFHDALNDSVGVFVASSVKFCFRIELARS